MVSNPWRDSKWVTAKYKCRSLSLRYAAGLFAKGNTSLVCVKFVLRMFDANGNLKVVPAVPSV
jgi:hypothetical protein